MGKRQAVLKYRTPPRGRLETLTFLRRRRPRSYEEWKALYEWNQLPAWETPIPGYFLRFARETAKLTQQELAARLGCSQPAVAQAERPTSNPTFEFLLRWGQACGLVPAIEWGLAKGRLRRLRRSNPGEKSRSRADAAKALGLDPKAE
jgi:transcriptional regulator with XRE-family HTH domain